MAKKKGLLRFSKYNRVFEGAKAKAKKLLFVTNLPFFTMQNTLIEYFERFGKVKKVDLLHTSVGDYTRSALVHMASAGSVEKIRKKGSHIIDGKRVRIRKYRGLSKHIKTYVEGDFSLYFLNLFVPLHPDVSVVNEAFQMLDDAFHQFKYTKIRMLCGLAYPEFDGNAYVTFADDRNSARIENEARNRNLFYMSEDYWFGDQEA